MDGRGDTERIGAHWGRRVSDYAAFFNMNEDRAGYLVEYGPTREIITNPEDKRTEDYVTGRFG